MTGKKRKASKLTLPPINKSTDTQIALNILELFKEVSELRALIKDIIGSFNELAMGSRKSNMDVLGRLENVTLRLSEVERVVTANKSKETDSKESDKEHGEFDS